MAKLVGSALEGNVAAAVDILHSDTAATTATLTNVASSASSVTLKALNANRLMLTIDNDSTVALFVKFGATSSATSYTVKMEAGDYFEMPHPVYTGVVDGIWASAAGDARVTEITA